MICNWCEEDYSNIEIELIDVDQIICKKCYPFVSNGIEENKEGNTLVLKIDALTFVKLLHEKGKQYNYIDFDPPYMNPDDPVFMKRVKADSKYARLNQDASHTRILASWKREKVLKYIRLMLKPKKGYIGWWHTMESELPSSDRGCKHVWVKDEMFGIGGRGCVNNGEYFFLEGPKVPIVETRMMGFYVYESAETKNNGIEIIRACAKPTEIFERILRHAGIETELKAKREFNILNPFTGAGRIIRAALKYQEGVHIDACDLDPKDELLGIWSEYMDHESMIKFFPMEEQKQKIELLPNQIFVTDKLPDNIIKDEGSIKEIEVIKTPIKKHDDLDIVLESQAYKKEVNQSIDQTSEFVEMMEDEEEEEEDEELTEDWFNEGFETEQIASKLGISTEQYKKYGLSEPCEYHDLKKPLTSITDCTCEDKEKSDIDDQEEETPLINTFQDSADQKIIDNLEKIEKKKDKSPISDLFDF